MILWDGLLYVEWPLSKGTGKEVTPFPDLRERVPHQIRTDAGRMTKGDMRDHRMGRPFGGTYIPFRRMGVFAIKRFTTRPHKSQQPPHRCLPIWTPRMPRKSSASNSGRILRRRQRKHFL